MDPHAPDLTPNRRASDLVQQAMQDDIREIKQALKTLADSMVKLALVEERQQQAASAQERILSAIERLDARVNALELGNVHSKRTTIWVERAIWAAAAAAVMLVWNKATK